MSLFMDEELLRHVIENRIIEIIFENEEFIKEDFNVEIDENPKNKILVRNKYSGGSKGKPIPHDTTIKYIKGKTFKHEGNYGLPFDIKKGEEPKISKKANTKANTSKLSKADLKFIKTFVKDNEDDILKYWNLNPDIPSEKKQMEAIQDKISDNYKIKTKKI